MKKCMFGSKTKQSNNKLTDTGDYDQGIGSQKLVFGSLQTRQIWPICPHLNIYWFLCMSRQLSGKMWIRHYEHVMLIHGRQLKLKTCYVNTRSAIKNMLC